MSEDRESKSSKREEDAGTRCQQYEQTQDDCRDRIAEMKKECGEKLDKANEDSKTDKGGNSSCQRCEQSELDHKKSMTEMDIHYKTQLEKERQTLRRKEEEFQSFKDRVARELALSLKTGDTESMNNPVSKIKLKEMYQHLRVVQWLKMRDNLKSNEENIKFASALLQKMFEDSRKQMEKNKRLIEEMCGLNENSEQQTPQKVREYTQLTIQNLQLALFYSRKEDVKSVMVTFRHLAAECYWLGCLMALNNPPLEPDWEKCGAGPDSGDIFPHGIKSGNEMESEPMEQ
ncbi:uncharacterized protein LOC111218723 isoform X2 [Seriola dumerili]|uniref:uncharacterized protein LOC111218723 isoform X2 n=1 Tax=Seriola dumerili TaxID=41447 RepID=UPI000BBF0E2C|nr:uncharacterized protein LOC111218723 isoform X2 [Seriola dumerili]